MKPVLILRHGEDIPAGLLADALTEAGVPMVEVRVDQGRQIPPVSDHSALVVLGGEMGAYEEATYPWLADEKRVIASAHEVEMPMLGICLGAQLFADSLGGRAYLADSPPEIVHMTPELTQEGSDDPVLREFDAPVVSWHQDTWEPPPDAVVLASSERFKHAFRCGSAVAVQAHPEADSAVVEGWMKHQRAMAMLDRAGVDPAELLETIKDGEKAQREMASRLFGAWVKEVTSHQSRPRTQRAF